MALTDLVCGILIPIPLKSEFQWHDYFNILLVITLIIVVWM
jgi:hypothetical protein